MKLQVALITLLLSGCSLTIGAGGSYYHNVPLSHLTGNAQFVGTIEGSIPLTDRWSIDTSLRHNYNGKGLGLGSGTNKGIDVGDVQLKYRFYFTHN